MQLNAKVVASISTTNKKMKSNNKIKINIVSNEVTKEKKKSHRKLLVQELITKEGELLFLFLQRANQEFSKNKEKAYGQPEGWRSGCWRAEEVPRG